MLRAQTAEGEFITLALLPKKQIEKIRKKKQFYCPACKGNVIVKAGSKVIPHFAHRADIICANAGGEGTYHQKGKLLLFDWLNRQKIQTELEAYIPAIKQRPDILIKIAKRYFAIEFQCVSIPTDEIRKRNEGYQRANIIPIWILGANQFKRSSTTHLRINSFALQFLQKYSSTLPTMLFYFCPQTSVFSLINDMYITSTNRALATFSFKKLQSVHFKSLFSYEKLSREKLYTLWKKEKKRFRLNRRRAYGTELTWRYWLYEKGLHLETLPSIVYLPIKSQHKMKVPLWNWQSRFIIEFLHPSPINKSFTLKEAEQFLQSFIYHDSVYPLSSTFSNPIKEYLSLLSDLMIIRKQTEHTYVKKKRIQSYQRIDQAIIGDNELLHCFMYNQKQE